MRELDSVPFLDLSVAEPGGFYRCSLAMALLASVLPCQKAPCPEPKPFMNILHIMTVATNVTCRQ